MGDWLFRRSGDRRLRPWSRCGTSSSLTALSDESGFTLVEILVAIIVLSVGLLGIAKMAIQASATTADTKAREGATNLTREVVESIVSLPYGSVDPSAISAELQAKPGLAPALGYSGWTVLRRDIPYALSVTGCSVDDPADGLGSHDETFCLGSGSSSSDDNPVDYRRFSVRVEWQRKDGPRSLSQTALVAPQGKGEAPSIKSLTSSSGVIITDPSVNSLNFTATTSAAPAGVAWSMDGGVRGVATGANTSWSFTWNIAGLSDGQYVIGAQAYNTAGTYGNPISLTVTLNRTPPVALTGFAAGWNRTISKVDAEWLASDDLDTAGYRVYRQQTAPTTGPVTPVNCGTVANPIYVTTKTTCTDASSIMPPSDGSTGTTTLRGASGATNGTTATSGLSIAKPAGVAPGDVLIATLAIMGRPGVTVPAGWTLIANTLSTNHEQATFYRVATSSEPSSYTFGVLGTSSWALAGGISAYYGVNTTAPVEAWSATTGTSGNAVSPNITTSSQNDRIINVVAFATVPTGSTITSASGLTERYDRYATSLSHALADAVQASAGATGTKTAVPSGANAGWISQLIALKPAPSGVNGIAVNYWVKAVDRDSTGNYREGLASNVVNAYAPNLAPTAVSSPLTCTIKPDGSSVLSWTQPAQPGDPDNGDFITFDRIYRDGVRYDTTGSGTEATYTERDLAGAHTYYVTTVDTRLMESTPSGSVTC